MIGDLMPDGVIVDLTLVDEAMADLELRAKRVGPAFRELRRPMRGDQRLHAKRTESPDGNWPPRSRATEERRRARNRRTRQTKAMRVISPKPMRRRSTPKALLGRLPRALKVSYGDLYIRATSRSDFGLAHNRGSKVGHGRKVELPRRTFLWLSDELLGIASEVIAKHMVKGWKR